MLRWSTIISAAVVVGGTSGASAMQRPSDGVVIVGRAPHVVGSGRFVSQRRAVGNFRAVEVRGSADVVVRVGPKPSLIVTADDNLLPILRSGIEKGDKLVLETTRSYRTTRVPRVMITVPQLSAFAVRGSSDAVIDGVRGDSLTLAVSGSGDIEARGRTGSLSVAVSGSGDVDAGRVSARNAAVVISGSGEATVRASGALTGAIQGSGGVNYIGRPATIAVRTAGSGSIRQAG